MIIGVGYFSALSRVAPWATPAARAGDFESAGRISPSCVWPLPFSV